MTILKDRHLHYIENRLNTGDFKMSFTSIKAFSENPFNFVNYRIGEKKVTPAMEFGTLLHLLVLEPHLFDEKYLVLKKVEGFENNTWTKKENKDHKLKMSEKAANENKTMIDEGKLHEAKELANMVLNNSIAGGLIEGCTKYEFGIKWEWEGLKWHGYVDGRAKNYCIDIKKVPNAKPSKLRWVQNDMRYAWQGYLYNVGLGNYEFQDYYNICFDDSGNVTVILQDAATLMLAKSQIMKTVKKFQECLITEQWGYSYEYWTKSGHYLSSEL